MVIRSITGSAILVDSGGNFIYFILFFWGGLAGGRTLLLTVSWSLLSYIILVVYILSRYICDKVEHSQALVYQTTIIKSKAAELKYTFISKAFNKSKYFNSWFFEFHLFCDNFFRLKSQAYIWHPFCSIYPSIYLDTRSNLRKHINNFIFKTSRMFLLIDFG